MKKIDCVMLVDDDHPTNILHTIAIEQTNCVGKVIAFINPKKALEYLTGEFSVETPKPNVIFLDINMPGMNGWEFLQEYQKLTVKQKSEIVLLMLSTSSHPEDLEKAENEDVVNGYIYKPLTKRIMLEVLEKHF